MGNFDHTVGFVTGQAQMLAEMLTEITTSKWEFDLGENSHWYFKLMNENKHHLFIDLSDVHGANPKYKISILWPSAKDGYRDYEPNKKVFSSGYTRGIKCLANAIKNRVLPVLEEHWDDCLDKMNSEEQEEYQRRMVVSELEKRFGREQAKHNKGNHTVYGKFGINKIQINHDGTRGTVDLSRSSMSMDNIKKLIDWLEENNTNN